ncbi:MAG: hypothetical protein JWQ35_1287 [Bacteriovoracaceae bacterium]|nr:hypothetical protein [Bacteriovoracaceae bacterium]
MKKKPSTILIVDDEAELREALGFEFKRKGFSVLLAEGGHQAFNLVSTESIDVVLSDVRMPRGNGIELLERIKAKNVDLPVFMFAALDTELSIEDAYDKGSEAIFFKPFDRKRLVEAVHFILTEKDQRWKGRTASREPINFEVELIQTNSSGVQNAKVFNIGRGGIFCTLKKDFPRTEDRLQFRIKIPQGVEGLPGAEIILEGTGIVRWVRNQQGEASPAGCGIEFQELSEDSLKIVLRIINGLRTRSYIPKSGDPIDDQIKLEEMDK